MAQPRVCIDCPRLLGGGGGGVPPLSSPKSLSFPPAGMSYCNDSMSTLAEIKHAHQCNMRALIFHVET